ncbi:MAG: helix-turn-helix domain-containing protein [Planctomycetota bacterium]
MSTELLSTRAAAKVLAISESTVRRWCDEGKLPSVRTAGGHRKIASADLITLMRETGQAPDKATLLSAGAARPKRPLHETASVLAGYLCAGREQISVATIAAAWSEGHSIATIGDELVGPAMMEVGRRWEAGEINVATERRACHLAMQGLFEIERLLPIAAESSPLALGGTPGTDHSQVGTKLVELLLRSIGWRTRQLGAGVPLRDIIETSRTAQPDLLWLSIVHMDDSDAFVEDYRHHVEPLLHQMTRITIGGRAVNLKIRRRIQFSFYGETLAALQTYAEGLSGVAAATPSASLLAPFTTNSSTAQHS